MREGGGDLAQTQRTVGVTVSLRDSERDSERDPKRDSERDSDGFIEKQQYG